MPISRALQSKIHIARQQLHLDDAGYRALLARVAGVESSTALNDRQAGAVLREFERLGFQPRAPRNAGKPRNFSASNAMPRMITKVEALLADMGLAWAYADSIADKMFGIKKCAWVRQPRQLKAIIAALHVEQEKRTLLARFELLIAELGSGPLATKWQATVAELPDGWQRSRRKLRALIEELEPDALHAVIHRADTWEE
jgi:phage gp16-like protein